MTLRVGVTGQLMMRFPLWYFIFTPLPSTIEALLEATKAAYRHFGVHYHLSHKLS